MQNSSDIDIAEAELQQELREMFAIDTQQHLETYFRLIQQLNSRSWVGDIQHLYRAIHTIKGGAVTVGADAMLHAAIELENLLGDLRYLEQAPSLTDGQLGRILLEAGELLSSSIEIIETGDLAIAKVQPTIRRLQELHNLVKQLYLPDWDELKQVHQEFAEQGFDLVILDLEMGLAKLPTQGVVSTNIIDKAIATITQLTGIGNELELAEGWQLLLQRCEALISKPDAQLWRSVWVEYFRVLKACVKQSGEISSTEIEQLDALTIASQSIFPENHVAISSISPISNESPSNLKGDLDDFFGEEELPDIELMELVEPLSISNAPSNDLKGDLDDFFGEEELPDIELMELVEPLSISNAPSNDLKGDLDDFFGEEELPDIELMELVEPLSISNESPSNLKGDLDDFFSEEELPDIEVMELVEPLSISNESPSNLKGDLDDFFSEKELPDIEVMELVEPLSISNESPSNLKGDLDDFFSEEELPDIEVMELVEPLSISNESPSNLKGDLDDFFSEEELPDIEVMELVEPLSISNESPSNLKGDLDDFFSEEELPDIESIPSSQVILSSIEPIEDLVDDLFSDRELVTLENKHEELGSPLNIAIEQRSIDRHEQQTIPEEANSDKLEILEYLSIAELDNFVELSEPKDSEAIALVESEPSSVTNVEPIEPLSAPPANIAISDRPVETIKRNIQIPVPLERLDRSAQQVVDTLLSARAVMNVSNQLQSQLIQLTTLTQESAQFVTRLRQLQDDYALLRNLSDEQDSGNNVTLERYRQGYTTINRLLENILRMSELGQEIETATYQSSSSLQTLDRSILRLKDSVETSRLVPFRNLTLRARAILRDLTNRYGKPVELVFENEQIELDAGIVQQLEPALLHLLRNAYDHGLESIEQRLKAGKPEIGLIHISLHRRGNLYRLNIEDDGGGIDRNSIHQIAISKGFPLNQTNTSSELLAVLCQPGFTSSRTVSEVSGRGVGMDVVLTQIASIGGKLSLETIISHGTKFSIEIPAPQLLVPCVLLQVGERTVAIPTEEVLETALLSSMGAEMDEQEKICNWTLTTDRGQVPGFDLSNYWQPFHRSLPDTAICLRTRQEEGIAEIWLIADDLLGQSELLINPLPSPLIAPIGLLGVSLQPDGHLISIFDPIALTASIATTPTLSTDDSFSTYAIEKIKPSAPTILIVDDAALMRRRFEASLNTHGFITHTCNDGVEALNWLQTNSLPDLMITDVEMPNMDGFTLIDRTRQAHIDIPILVVSSRLSAEWGKEARRLGANDYLNKGFSTAELLQKVNSLLALAWVLIS